MKNDKIWDSMKFCRESKCEYYFGEINECMSGEPEVTDDMERKCKTDNTIVKEIE